MKKKQKKTKDSAIFRSGDDVRTMATHCGGRKERFGCVGAKVDVEGRNCWGLKMVLFPTPLVAVVDLGRRRNRSRMADLDYTYRRLLCHCQKVVGWMLVHSYGLEFDGLEIKG